MVRRLSEIENRALSLLKRTPRLTACEVGEELFLNPNNRNRQSFCLPAVAILRRLERAGLAVAEWEKRTGRIEWRAA